jgi:phage-related holin
MCTKCIERPKKALWFYGCNFIAQWSPTCFGHSCGHLQGGEDLFPDISLQFQAVHYAYHIVTHQSSTYLHELSFHLSQYFQCIKTDCVCVCVCVCVCICARARTHTHTHTHAHTHTKKICFDTLYIYIYLFIIQP